MMFFEGFLTGLFIGIVLMCIIQSIRINDAVTTVKQCESALEHEIAVAINENRNVEYINGMSRSVRLFKAFYEEELE